MKHKPLTHFSADRLIYASFCAPYNIATLLKQCCHATKTTLPRYGNIVVAAWQ
ncbi:hypothetical protein [Leyella stercorea]|uniref:hypothetical protein n=1 Tax=Leyella stercorea TaxID=363265 RepID=UPI003AF14B95